MQLEDAAVSAARPEPIVTLGRPVWADLQVRDGVTNRHVVTRTAEGDRVVRQVDATIDGLGQQWSDLVGRQEYRTFLRVLAPITLDDATA